MHEIWISSRIQNITASIVSFVSHASVLKKTSHLNFNTLSISLMILCASNCKHIKNMCEGGVSNNSLGMKGVLKFIAYKEQGFIFIC